ncbi:nmrA-like family domain-containing protein 1 [Aplysia californica]|uniref:NmrA-like family domain-containing protein 1 n=1 Tax=Aplysia californica TaxID=6500 RepID=A0ABM1A951_APLCA|nr:nmrA-like family domain-containing protein 1 [Aplysia californica]
MSGRKVVVVFGATGMQGGSVARALARSGQFTVRGVTRDLESKRAQDLVADGVDLMNYDLNERSGLQLILNGAYACFVNTATDFFDPNCLDTEIAQGCLIADYCKSEGVRHVVFSSQLHSVRVCSIMARHLVAKAEIEQYMRELALPLTCLIMPVYYQDLCHIFRPRTTDGRNYDIEIPMGQTPLDMMSVDDVGGIVVSVLLNRDFYLDKTVSVCGDKITVREMALALSKYLRPKVFKDKQLTVYEFNQRRCQDLPGATDWANMFQFFMRVDQRYNLSESKKLNPAVRSFEQWVEQNAAMLNEII